MKPRVRFAVAGVAVVLAGCSGRSEPAAPAAVAAGTATEAPLPACTALFRVGRPTPQPVPLSGNGITCAIAHGAFVVGGFPCRDGGLLWAVDAATGVRGWGRAGGAFHPAKTDMASDPQYGVAYRGCVG